MNQTQFTIGIITGSGPEAGIDLWSKVLRHTQSLLGSGYSGDLDAPRVVIVSEPELGLSMDLRLNEAATWAAMDRTARQIATQADVYVIACNTLNVFAPRIATATFGMQGRLLSFQDVLHAALTDLGVTKVGLLGAAPVTALDDLSPYTALTRDFDVVLPPDTAALQSLIFDIKRLGSQHPSLADRLSDIVAGTDADTVLLACTELPLIARPVAGKTLIDVTDAVALRLARMAVEQRNAA